MIKPVLRSVFGRSGRPVDMHKPASFASPRGFPEPDHRAVRAPDTLLAVSVFRAALVALGATVLTAACAAGQQAATSEEKPTLDGTQGQVGQIQLEGVALHPPTGKAYSSGASVPLSVYIVNNGQTSDKLTGISSPAFSGWSVTSTAFASSKSGTSSAAIRPGSAVGFSMRNLTPTGGGSPRSIVLSGLSDKNAPLFPGNSVRVTFTFAKAGQTTLTVPVALSEQPNSASVAAPSSASE
jgi:copper(I)-binding protein